MQKNPQARFLKIKRLLVVLIAVLIVFAVLLVGLLIALLIIFLIAALVIVLVLILVVLIIHNFLPFGANFFPYAPFYFFPHKKYGTKSYTMLDNFTNIVYNKVCTHIELT